MLPALIFSIVQSRPLFLQFLPESLILQRRSSMLTQLRCDVVVIAVCRLCSVSCSRLVFSVLSVERNFCYIVCCMSVRALMRVLMLAAIPERLVSLSWSGRSCPLLLKATGRLDQDFSQRPLLCTKVLIRKTLGKKRGNTNVLGLC